MQDLIFYTNPMSRARVVRWMLEEVGEPYSVEVKEFGTSMKAPDYLAINPMGKVPAIRHGDVVVTEVSAICAYLADRFPNKGLAPPPVSPERGPYYRWMFFLAGPYEMATTAKAFNWPITAEAAGAVGCGRIDDALSTLAQAVVEADPWLCGDRFTAADLLVASYLGWHMDQKIIEERPALRAYVDRARARPAAQRANDLDDALVKAPA